MTDEPVTAAPGPSPLCPACGAAAFPGDRFCEVCGATLDPDTGEAAHVGALAHAAEVDPSAPAAGGCLNCAAAPEMIGADGYCQQCGFKQPSPRDHLETVLARTAGVTDKGLHHHRNEDAMALVEVDATSTVAVVCDGVSSSVDPDIASQMAVDLAAGMLVHAVQQRPGELAAATVEAVAAAQAAVAGLTFERRVDLAAPSCTYVSAVVTGSAATIGWVGDSRAYWLGPGAPAPAQLTVDDSWVAEQVALGLMTEAEAETDARAHAITRWLGADAPAGDAHVAELAIEGPGTLLVCSDGLWNYAPSAERIAALAGAAPDPTPLGVARHLTDFALDAGGHDNITVVVIPVDPAPSAAPPVSPDPPASPAEEPSA